MGRIMMFFRAIFAMHSKELRMVTRELNVLAENVKPLLRKSPDWCAALVGFYNLTSPWHDRGLHGLIAKLKKVNWRGQQDSKIEQLCKLQEVFERSGRGGMWNRSKHGEVVTENNVYLGDVFGAWPFSIASFRNGHVEHRTTPWKGSGYGEYLEDKSVFEVVSDYQARPFIQENGRSIIEAVNSLAA